MGAVNNINPQTHRSFSQHYFIPASDPRHVCGRYKPYNKSEPLATFSEFRIKQWVSGKILMIYTKEKKNHPYFSVQTEHNTLHYVLQKPAVPSSKAKHESVIQQSLITVTCL